MKKILILGAIIALSGCASTPDFSTMTPEQIRAYHAYRAYQSQQVDALVGQMNATSQTFQQIQNSVSQTPQYRAPEVWSPNQQNNTVLCHRIGNTIRCQDR